MYWEILDKSHYNNNNIYFNDCEYLDLKKLKIHP